MIFSEHSSICFKQCGVFSSFPLKCSCWWYRRSLIVLLRLKVQKFIMSRGMLNESGEQTDELLDGSRERSNFYDYLSKPHAKSFHT